MILSAEDVAAVLGVSARSVTRAVERAGKAGTKIGKRIGRSLAFERADIERIRPFVRGRVGNPNMSDPALNADLQDRAVRGRRKKN
jgi:transposase